MPISFTVVGTEKLEHVYHNIRGYEHNNLVLNPQHILVVVQNEDSHDLWEAVSEKDIPTIRNYYRVHQPWVTEQGFVHSIFTNVTTRTP